MKLLRPANLSLMQLVLLGFVGVVLPLVLLVFQAANAYRELSAQAELSAREAVAFTRRSQALQTLALDMERTSRQYLIVEEASLLELLESQFNNFSTLVKQPYLLFPVTPAQELLEALLEQQALHSLADVEYIASLADLTESLTNQTQNSVDQRLQAMQQQLLSLQKQLVWQFLMLLSLSLLLVIYFTWRLLRPIDYLQKRINSLANPNNKNKTKQLQEGPAELIHLDVRLNWLEEQLDEIEQQKAQFLRHISHELKTPLASIREAGDLLHEEVLGSLTPSQKEVTGLLEQNSRRLQELIEQLLDYNLLQGKKQLEVASINLDNLLQRLLAPWQPLLEQRQQLISLPQSGLQLTGDISLLRSTLDNLLTNALHYGNTSKTIQLRAGVEKEVQWIEVENAGIPIPEHEQKRLFEPFYQGSGKRRGAVKGSGLGLSIAADCMKAHTGHLELLTSNEDATIFRLVWPTNLI
ncbi:MAG: HAMP domain-containing histidine kinase [Pseudomonadaceae bacterium]|nr:HAMP domain-containing histidine kinase [Pseudomonadaceae bacterium]